VLWPDARGPEEGIPWSDQPAAAPGSAAGAGR
jgi:hypothetical protein